MADSRGSTHGTPQFFFLCLKKSDFVLTQGDDNDYYTSFSPDAYRGHFAQFQEFLARAAQCRTVFSSSSQRRLILLEELPNLLHGDTRSQFHGALESLVLDPDAAPVIIIISESGTRGEEIDERLASGSWGKDKDTVVDIRTVLSRELLHGQYVTQMRCLVSIVIRRRAYVNRA